MKKSDIRVSPKPVFSLDTTIETALFEVLKNRFNVSIDQTSRIADSILKLSDYYIQNPRSETPWEQEWCQIAYLSYYLPLNFIRFERVLTQILKISKLVDKDFISFNQVVDFGSGLGSATMKIYQNFNHSNFEFLHIEKSKTAVELHQDLLKSIFKNKSVLENSKWQNFAPETVTKKTLGIFSYSLAELKSLPAYSQDCESLLILEPATQAQGRNLMKIREDYLKLGFYPWAPCTHDKNCPLLIANEKDWCHDRIHFNRPSWFIEIEHKLPIKNENLTLSYLFLKRTPLPLPKNLQIARLTGDALHEKGKTRQLFCHNEKREFFAWMHKNSSAQELPRGELVFIPSEQTIKSNETRVENVDLV